MKHYGRFLPQEKLAQAAEILNEVWEPVSGRHGRAVTSLRESGLKACLRASWSFQGLGGRSTGGQGPHQAGSDSRISARGKFPVLLKKFP